MYKLTPRMLQRFRSDLGKFHDLFTGGRCEAWQLEELLVAAIKSDTSAAHSVFWTEKGHDDHADLIVRTNGELHPIQVKSGKIKPRKKTLAFSGHRLGRFDGDMNKISSYLNSKSANILSVPYRQEETEMGRQHIYRVTYIDIKHFTGLSGSKWTKHGSYYIQQNDSGVEFSIRPTMSWQVWYEVPLTLIDREAEFSIG